jgi:hypothetical protein
VGTDGVLSGVVIVIAVEVSDLKINPLLVMQSSIILFRLVYNIFNLIESVFAPTALKLLSNFVMVI